MFVYIFESLFCLVYNIIYNSSAFLLFIEEKPSVIRSYPDTIRPDNIIFSNFDIKNDNILQRH